MPARGRVPRASLLKIRAPRSSSGSTSWRSRRVGSHAVLATCRATASADGAGHRDARGDRRGRHYFNMRKTSIYGGSNEIQRNIIAKVVLGL